jgi:putative glutamine amidotransferase
VDAVSRAGGVPVIIPLVSDPEELKKLYGFLDGILFAGGNDLSSGLYGEEPYNDKSDASSVRDAVETLLLKWSLGDKKPILGICRGMQLLNVLLGGTLYQHIPADLPEALDHDASTKKKSLVDTEHLLSVKPDSKLATLLQTDSIGTNAHHHQAIKKLGADLRAVAWTSDKVIEAIELVGDQFALGLQSHPESLVADAEPRWRLLFEGFVTQSRHTA